MIDFQPDYTWYLTAMEAEYQFEGFKFKGPGWYIIKAPTTSIENGAVDVILVIPYKCPDNVDPFKQIWENKTKFNFHYYYDRNPGHMFGLISNAPTRQDER